MATHQRKTLVQQPQCRVELCSCGVYHLHTGPVSLRMNRPQLEALFEGLGLALTPSQVSERDGDPPIH